MALEPRNEDGRVSRMEIEENEARTRERERIERNSRALARGRCNYNRFDRKGPTVSHPAI